MDETRERHDTPRLTDACQFCGASDAFVMQLDAPFPNAVEIEMSPVFLKTCVVATRWRWCWREQRLLASLRSPLDERFVLT